MNNYRENLVHKVGEFRKEIKNFPDRDFFLPLIPVYCRIRESGSFDGISSLRKANSVDKVCDQLGIYTKRIALGDNIKIIFSTKKEVLDRLYRLHDDVFSNNIKEAHREYGLLLGYPPCCVNMKVDFGFPLLSAAHLFFNNPWPWELNLFAEPPLIYHYPCSSSCKESLKIANQILKIYTIFDSASFANIKYEHLKPILYFEENMFIKFKKVIKFLPIVKLRATIIEHQGIHIFDPTGIEDGSISNSQKGLLKKRFFFNRGNRIIVTDRKVKVLKNEKLIFVYRKRNLFNGVLIFFK